MKSDRKADFFKVYKIFIVELLVRFCNCLSCPDKAGKTGRLFLQLNMVYKSIKNMTKLSASNDLLAFLLL